MRIRRTDVFTTVVDGQTVILDALSSQYLTTNSVGTFILHSLAEECSPKQLAAAVASEFGVSYEVAGRDSEAFTAQLDEHGLLEG